MKSPWLPWLPLYCADLLGVRSAYGLSDERVGTLVIQLCGAWMRGEPTTAEGSDRAFMALWPHLAEELEIRRAQAPLLSERGRKARAAQLLAGKKPARSRQRAGPSPSPLPSESESEAPRPPGEGKAVATRPAANGAASLPARPALETWVTPFWNLWAERYGGQMTVPKWAKVLKWAVAIHGEAKAVEAFGNMIWTQEQGFATPGAYQERFGVWLGTKPARRAQESRAERGARQIDEMAQRVLENMETKGR